MSDETSKPASQPDGLEEFWNDRLPELDLPRMSDDALRKLILDFVDGRIFTSVHIPSNQMQSMLSMVFMPLALGALHKVHPDSLANIGLIYEYLDQAAPRSINGMPIFFSCRMVHKDDWQRAIPAIQAEEERRKNIPV